MAGVILIILICFVILFFIKKSISSQENLKPQVQNPLQTDWVNQKAIRKIELPKTTHLFYPVFLKSKNDRKFKINRINTEPYFYFSKTGSSELLFYNYLKKYFDPEKITHNEYFIALSKKKYLPDFLYIDEIRKIYLDIEIDECYVFEENTPIHYYHLSDFNFKKEPISIDFHRDIELVIEGCNVIRFSEKQIIQQPIECCKFLANCIDYLFQNNTYSKKFSPVIELPPDDVWSFSTSKKRAIAKYRDEIKSKRPDGIQFVYNILSESHEKEHKIREQKN